CRRSIRRRPSTCTGRSTSAARGWKIPSSCAGSARSRHRRGPRRKTAPPLWAAPLSLAIAGAAPARPTPLFRIAGGQVVFLQKLVLADRLFLDLGLGDDQVDDLVLEDRGAELGLGVGVLAQQVEHLLGLSAVLHRLAADGFGEFLLGHLDVVGAADLGEHEAETHPPLGDLAVLLLELLVALLG